MDVQLPDGRILRGVPEGTTKAQIAAKVGLPMDQAPAQQAAAPSSAQQMQQENPLLRTAGRAGRNIASGLAAMGDVALLPVKTAALGAGIVTGSEGLKKFGMTPSLHDSTQGVIDQATGNKLQPTGPMDKAFDFGAEMLTGIAGSFLPSKAVAKAPGIVDAVRGVMNPAEVIGNIPKYQVPGGGSQVAKRTSEEIRKSAGDKFKEAEALGGRIKSEETNKFLDEVEKLKPQSNLGKMLSKESPFTKITNTLLGYADENGNIVGGIRNKELSFDDVKEADEFLADEIDSFVDKTTGKMDAQGKKLLDIQTKLREMATGNGEEGFGVLREARKEWAKSLRLADIERIIQRADQMQVPATGIQTGFRTLYNNPARMRGFTEAEKAAIKKVADGAPVTDLLRAFGSKLIPIGLAVKGGPVGAAAGYAGAQVSKDAATKVAMSKAEKVADLIRGQTGAVSAPLSAKQKAIAAALANTTARGQ